VFFDGIPRLLFRLDGKTYTTRDKEIMDRVRALNPAEDSQGAPDLNLAKSSRQTERRRTEDILREAVRTGKAEFVP
jgi:hypothetical protein